MRVRFNMMVRFRAIPSTGRSLPTPPRGTKPRRAGQGGPGRYFVDSVETAEGAGVATCKCDGRGWGVRGLVGRWECLDEDPTCIACASTWTGLPRTGSSSDENNILSVDSDIVLGEIGTGASRVDESQTRTSSILSDSANSFEPNAAACDARAASVSVRSRRPRRTVHRHSEGGDAVIPPESSRGFASESHAQMSSGHRSEGVSSSVRIRRRRSVSGSSICSVRTMRHPYADG